MALVAPGSTNPLPPYASWATAATNIHDAVDAATLPGALVLVSNGTYATGGRAPNRVAVDKLLIVRSVNGPEVTIIRGGPGTTNFNDAIRCVYLANGASLSGFTLTNGGAGAGGGVYCESEAAGVSNCVVVGNSADSGGGVYQGMLDNCTISTNSSLNYGGGACSGTLNNCTLIGNSAKSGTTPYGRGASLATLNNCTLTGNSPSGVAFGRLNNCIVYFNGSPTAPCNWEFGGEGTMNYCCTTPLPDPLQGVGNITNAPLFVDNTGGNLRLQSNSPCINAGNNAYAPAGPDLDGNPRIVSGTVDIGAYEYQEQGSLISYAWLQQFGLPTDGTADSADTDADGLNNWQEWYCWTCPTNCLSALRLLSASPTGTNVTVCWQSVAGVSYFLERSTNLAATPCFTCVATNLRGQSGTTSYTDTNAPAASPLFYRVAVGP